MQCAPMHTETMKNSYNPTQTCESCPQFVKIDTWQLMNKFDRYAEDIVNFVTERPVYSSHCYGMVCACVYVCVCVMKSDQNAGKLVFGVGAGSPRPRKYKRRQNGVLDLGLYK